MSCLFGCGASAPSSLDVLISTAVIAPSIDEVGIDLGPDDAGSGVLDDWTGGTDEGSSERTGTLSSEAVVEQRRLALLSRLGRDPGDLSIPKHITALEGQAQSSIQELLMSESLDPLPSPGSLDSPPIQAHRDSSEGEVTRARMGPLLPGSELDEVTAANIEQTESFSSTAEVTRIRPRPVAEQEPQKKRSSPLIALTITGWLLALLSFVLMLLKS